MRAAGAAVGAAAALLLSCPAAAKPAPPAVVAATRRLPGVLRTVPTLVLALVFVHALGLGAFAGMLAVAVHSAGAGGIGEGHCLAVRQFEYQDIPAILVLILATVACIDLLCGPLRARVVGARAA